MKVNVRLMLKSDIPQVIAIENYWDYLSKWGKEGYTKVLQNSYIYYSLVAETKYHSKFPSSVSDTKIIGLAVLAFLFANGEYSKKNGGTNSLIFPSIFTRILN